MQTDQPFKTGPWSLEMGDFIGMESCVDVGQNAQLPLVINGSATTEECLPRSCCVKHDRLTTSTSKENKEYPPPILRAERLHRRSLSVEHDWQTTAREKEFRPPIGTVAKVCLRRSCSVKIDRQTTAIEKEFPPPMSSRRVLKRCYSIDGRLIIREEEGVRHLDYSRSNGRLTLKLISPPAAAVESFVDEEAEEKNVESKPQDEHEEAINNDGEEVAVNSSPALGGGEGGVKCYRPLPCSFGMPVPAIGPCIF